MSRRVVVVVVGAVVVMCTSYQLGMKTDSFYQVLEAVLDQRLQEPKVSPRTVSVVFSRATVVGLASLPLEMTLCNVEISWEAEDWIVVVRGGSLTMTDLVLEYGYHKVVVVFAAAVVAVAVAVAVAVVVVVVVVVIIILTILLIP
jgi:hypothetical protein